MYIFHHATSKTQKNNEIEEQSKSLSPEYLKEEKKQEEVESKNIMQSKSVY